MTSSRQIIIIDDEADMCWVLERLLRRRGYFVSAATTGETGLALLARVLPKLAIIDCKLPDRDGLDVADEAINLHPDVSLILISGFPFAEESELSERVLALNAHFLAKPFEVSDLAALVDQIMQAKTSEGRE
jgi:DNA-binding NtrC family response regulator